MEKDEKKNQKRKLYHQSESLKSGETIPASKVRKRASEATDKKGGARRSFTLPPQPASRLEKRNESVKAESERSPCAQTLEIIYLLG